MDILIRFALSAALGAGFAVGPPWAALGLLVLYPLASGLGARSFALVGVFYAMALAPVVVAAIDYSGSWAWSVLAWVVPWSINTVLIGVALSRSSNTRGLVLLLTTVALALPPLSSLSVVTPASLAGFLFPGTGVVGLALLALCIAFSAVTVSSSRIAISALVAIMTVIGVSNAYAQRSVAEGDQSDFRGIHTYRGMPSADQTSLYRAPWRFHELAVSNSTSAATVVFPESTFGDWHRGDGQVLALSDKRIIGGARVSVDDTRYVNVLLRGSMGDIVYAQQNPIPLSFGLKRRAVSARGRIVVSAEQRVNALLCIELTNPWRVANTFYRADTPVIWAANLGWTEHHWLVRRLMQELDQWARLFAIGTVSAINHAGDHDV